MVDVPLTSENLAEVEREHAELLKRYRDAYEPGLQAVADNMERIYGMSRIKAKEIARHGHLTIESAKVGIEYGPIDIHVLSVREIRRFNNRQSRRVMLARGQRQTAKPATLRRVGAVYLARIRSFGRSFRPARRSAVAMGGSGDDSGGGDSSSGDGDLPRRQQYNHSVSQLYSSQLQIIFKSHSEKFRRSSGSWCLLALGGDAL